MRYEPTIVESTGGVRPLRHSPATVPPAASDSQRSLALTLVRAGGSLLTACATPESGPAADLTAVARRVAAMIHLGVTDTKRPSAVQSRCHITDGLRLRRKPPATPR